MSIISKLKDSRLKGRGGSDYPVGQKWQMVKSMQQKSFIICNAAESEPGVFKDGYINVFLNISKDNYCQHGQVIP